MGCYEYVPQAPVPTPTPIPTDLNRDGKVEILSKVVDGAC
jgi:hypothetical protein